MICLTRMKRILEVNTRDRYAIVEPGVVNLWLTRTTRPARASTTPPTRRARAACTIGGNVATNSGGPHTLKYGVTVNHVLGVELVLPDGRSSQTGGADRGQPGLRPDRRHRRLARGRSASSPRSGSRLTRDPEACRTLLGVFDTRRRRDQDHQRHHRRRHRPRGAGDARHARSSRPSRQAFHFGFPLDAGAVLIIEVDGLDAGLDARGRRRIAEIVADATAAREVDRLADTQGARVRRALEEPQVRRSAPSAGSAPTFCTQDGVVPRTKLPHILRFITRDRRAVRPPDRQRLPRRRRQHPPDPALRRARRRPGQARAGGEPRDPRRVHRRRRQRHRRARHRRREDRLHAQAVHARRPGA